MPGIQQSASKHRWHIFNFFRNRDNFGMDVPSFNIQGSSKLNTVLGGLFSTLILIIALSFASTGLVELFQRSNPIVNVNYEKDYYFSNKLSFSKSNINIAFGAGERRLDG